MRVLFFAASSSYVHTLLAPRYLAVNSPVPVDIHETNVNVPVQKNLDFILAYKPDVIAFSCYIFNIAYIKKLLSEIKVLLPETIVILGGYEAAFQTDLLLPLCSYIIKGEGDLAFGELLLKIQNGEFGVPNIIEAGTVKNLDGIISPYTDEYLSLAGKNHILYMETCRGCPFGCAYCMSANTHGVRSFSLPRIFDDFEKIMKYHPPLVKLVDRTFNYDKRRAEKIFAFLIEHYGDQTTRFHFEMAPELFDESLYETLSKAPDGLFQFEIGVQSYHKETLTAVHRPADCEKVDASLRRLISLGNIRIHVDLIAGLPCETKKVFIEGFDRLLSLRPDCMQEGFLKILPGSEISDHREGYTVSELPPYEIVSSPDMTEADLAELKKAGEMLDLYYNSGRFKKGISFLLDRVSPYVLFKGLSDHFESRSLTKQTMSAPDQYDALFNYASAILSPAESSTLEHLLYDDFIAAGNTRRWHRWIKNK